MSLSLMQCIVIAVTLLALALFLLCSNKKVIHKVKIMLGLAKGTAGPVVGVVVGIAIDDVPAPSEAAPPPLLPPAPLSAPRTAPGRISLADLAHFMRGVPDLYNEAIASGHAGEVAWMETSGLRRAALAHLQMSHV